MVNRIVLIGRLTKDPEVRETQTGKKYATFSIAVNKRIKPSDGSRDADFFNIKTWGQTADYVGNYLTKGRLVSVDGRLETRQYQDNNGNNRDYYEIVADNVNGLDRARDDNAGAPTRGGGDNYAAGVNQPGPDVDYDPFADS